MPIIAEVDFTNWYYLRTSDHDSSSYKILFGLVGLASLIYLLYRMGYITVFVRTVSSVVRGAIRRGFRAWERYLSPASWLLVLELILVLIILGVLASDKLPLLTLLLGAVTVYIGVISCLAYMFIDLERYEVERGYKAVHNPMKGQMLALNLIRYGDRVGVPLLIAAAVGAIGGFALLNQGIYETIGTSWYTKTTRNNAIEFVDFLAYAVINLYRAVDLLDLANTYQLTQFNHVRQIFWPASILLTLYKTFFTFVLLQQIFASIRQGQALAESISDFWSPHLPIQERARISLPQHGISVVRPLMNSLKAIPALTQEQREQLPQVIAMLGPMSTPILMNALSDPHEGVRAVSAAALGQLSALDALPALVSARKDSSELVRQEVARAIGRIGGPGLKTENRRERVVVLHQHQRRRFWIFGKRGFSPEAHRAERVRMALQALRDGLSDANSVVRIESARGLGLMGPAAADDVRGLIDLLGDADETVQTEAATALGLIQNTDAIAPLIDKLSESSPKLIIAVIRSLGLFRTKAKSSVPALVEHLQHSEQEVRMAAIEALGEMGSLPDMAMESLIEGLLSPDSVVRAQTAEAVGSIGMAAGDVAPALVQSLKSGNDMVRTKAAEALGKLGPESGAIAIDGLIVALQDKDTWVRATAAHAIGELGSAASRAVPELTHALQHTNALVRKNAIDALGKIGPAARAAYPDVLNAIRDEDGGVRAQAIATIGQITDRSHDSAEAAISALQDPDPRVRSVAVQTLAKMELAIEQIELVILPLLEDPNDDVKQRTLTALAELAAGSPAVIEGLCRRLLEDDSETIQAAAAYALGQLGSTAIVAGGALLRAARTGDAQIRQAAVRAIVRIQPPERDEALIECMKDVDADVRIIASAGWMKVETIPEQALPALTDALRDPEVQIRSNAAHAISRYPDFPEAALPLLLDCSADPNDGLRLNTAMALKNSGHRDAYEVFRRMLTDPNARIQLFAASVILTQEPENQNAIEIVRSALSDPAPRQRKVALETIGAYSGSPDVFLDALVSQIEKLSDEDERTEFQELADRLGQKTNEPTVEIETPVVVNS